MKRAFLISLVAGAVLLLVFSTLVWSDPLEKQLFYQVKTTLLYPNTYTHVGDIQN